MPILYNSIIMFFFLALLPALPFIFLFSEKRRGNMLQRLGLINLISNKGVGIKRIWLHALSVGEVKSALPLVNALKEQYIKQQSDSESICLHEDQLKEHQPKKDQLNYELIITASTRTGFAVAQDLFLDRSTPTTSSVNSSKFFKLQPTSDSSCASVPSFTSTAIQVGYFPYDLPFSVKKICSVVDPDLVIIMESDLWPGFLWHMRDKLIPVFLVNGRLSKSSSDGYMLFRRLFAQIFSLFSKIMVQTELDRARFVKIGVDAQKVTVTGNIKFDQPMPSLDLLRSKTDNLNGFENGLSRRYILAGSTHPGEEEILLSAFVELKQTPLFHDLGLIVAPRDPGRAINIKNIFNAKGLKAQLLSGSSFLYNPENRGQYLTIVPERNISLHTPEKVEIDDIIIVDKMGILSQLYSICDIAFIGGSLLPFGGHNPLEPSLFSKPVIFGIHMDDFKEVAETMLSNGAAFMVKDKDELLGTLSMLLNDRAMAQQTGENAGRLVEKGRGAVDKILSVIQNSCDL